MVGLHPIGGVAWDYLQYVIGLHRLGHDVYYYEDTWHWPYHPMKGAVADGGYSGSFLRRFFRRYAPELDHHWQYLHLHEKPYGMTRRQFESVAKSADLFINLSGASAIPDVLGASCVKAFVDTDPGYNQILLTTRPAWAANVDQWAAAVDAHDVHFSYAENINEPDCKLPDTGHSWLPTRMAVVPELWRPAMTPLTSRTRWTTVMTWNAFKGELVMDGQRYGSKDAEFGKIIDLPRSVDVPLTIAIGGATAPVSRLRAAGWRVLAGPKVSLTPARYQRFLGSSRGEVSIAKEVYVALRTGWFSCRSACYLALGVPVVVQDTGFSSHVPTGAGLLAFTSHEEAAAAIDAVESDYARHSEAAIELSRSEFGAPRILSSLIEAAASR